MMRESTDCIEPSDPHHEIEVARSAPVRNGERSKEVKVVGGGRNVDATCVNASNPYHQCTRYCSQRTPEARRQTERRKSVSMGGVKMEENRTVDPRCMNASNPYHQCSNYCLQRGHKMGLVAGGKSEESGRIVKKVERMGVNLKCTYASNPYHTCAGYCLQKIQKAM